MSKLIKYGLVILVLVFSTSVLAGNGKRIQRVDFDGSDVDGKVRQPDGSYIVQKRKVNFVPLYNLRKNFDQQIEESIEYLR